MSNYISFNSAGGFPTTSFTAGTVVPLPRDIPVGKRVRVEHNPLSAVNPLTRSDAADEGGEIISQIVITRDRWPSFPQLHAVSQPGLQPGSLVFTAAANNPRETRGMSLQAMNALLFMMNGVHENKTLTEITSIFKFSGIATTEQSDRNVAHRAHVPLYDTSGTTSSVHRLMQYGKWENVLDVWSDAIPLFSHASNPAWARNLQSVLATSICDGVTLCLALVPIHKGYLREPSMPPGSPPPVYYHGSYPFADWYDVDRLNTPNTRVDTGYVYQYVPIALKRGFVPTPDLFSDIVQFADQDDAPEYMRKGFDYPVQLFTIGTVHMRNPSDVSLSTLRFPDPRRILFPTAMDAAAHAMTAGESRKKLPVQIAWREHV